MRRASLPGAFVCAAALASLGARAVEIGRTSDDDPALAVEARAFYKAYGARVTLHESLVEGSARLDDTLADLRAQLPPEQAALLPDDAALPEHVWLTTHTLRLMSTAHWFGVVDLDVAWQGALVAATDARFVPRTQASATPSASGAVPGVSGNTGASQRRLVDVEPVIASADGTALLHNFDQLALSYHSSAVSVVVGRQVVSWGAGRLWNPTDLFSPFAPTDVDREVRRGADAVRVSVPLGDTTEVDVLWLPQLQAINNGAVVRARTNVLAAADLSITLAKYVGDLVAGADVAADIGPFGLYAEAAYTFPIGAALATGAPAHLDVRASFVRAVAGAMWRPLEPLTLIGEYHYNGFGALGADEYADKLRSARVTRGEVFGVAQHYVGLASAWTLDDLTSVSATGIVNVLDPSALVVAALERSLSSSLLLRAGATFPFGAGVDVERFAALAPDLGIRSEYGLTPFTVFLQLGVYFG